MDKLNALLETEEFQLMQENNQELIESVTNETIDFVDVLKGYVHDNPEIFIEADVEDMKKNVRIFAEAAMNQFLVEVTTLASSELKIIEPVTPENALDEYI